LYYRLNVVRIKMPPLRQRPEDIRLLSTHFIEKYAPERKTGQPITGLDAEVDRLFLNYNWPGNVRELENVIERAMVMCPGATITVNDLPREFRDQVSNTLHLDGIPADAKLYDTLAWVEQRMITRAMQMSDNVQARAAEILGIGKSGLNQKLKKYKLDFS
jgi:two-component system NtrC family response regulator